MANITIKLIEFNSIMVNLTVILLIVLNTNNIHHFVQILCSQKILGILFCVSIKETIVIPCPTHEIIVILHIFKFISLVLSIMDVNLTAIACNTAILIVMKSVYAKMFLLVISVKILQHMIY